MPTKYFLDKKVIKCEDTGEECVGYTNYLKSNHWMIIRTNVLHSRKKCEMCGTDDNLQLHHITYKNIGHEDAEKDLCVLCQSCHALEHKALNEGKTLIRRRRSKKSSKATKVYKGGNTKYRVTLKFKDNKIECKRMRNDFEIKRKDEVYVIYELGLVGVYMFARNESTAISKSKKLFKKWGHYHGIKFVF